MMTKPVGVEELRDSVQDRVRGDSLRATLKALPIDVRADVLASMFQVIASEFAAMVLEHVKPRRSVKHSVDNVSRQTVSTKPRAKKPRGARQRGAQLKRSTAQARRRTR